MTAAGGIFVQPETATVIVVPAYRRVVGDELRKVRKSLGWTRKVLRQRLPSEVSVQTLATYELGTRECALTRFVELCVTMRANPAEVLSRIHERVVSADRPGLLYVSLREVVRDPSPALEPLRGWARERLGRVVVPEEERVGLDIAALESLSTLCQVDTATLVHLLRSPGIAGEAPPPLVSRAVAPATVHGEMT